MKISREETESSLRYLRKTPPPHAPLHTISKVSQEDLSAVLAACGNSDEIRSALVAELTRELADQSYEVPSDWVAEKLVGRIVSDRLR